MIYYLRHMTRGRPSVAQQLRSRWIQVHELDTLAGATSRQDLYFGTGGSYTAEALLVRASMLGELEAEVRLMNNDLTILLNEIVSRPSSRASATDMPTNPASKKN